MLAATRKMGVLISHGFREVEYFNNELLMALLMPQLVL